VTIRAIRAALYTATPLLALMPTPALAAPAVSIDSAIFIEHTQLRDGTEVRSLEPAHRLSHGDRVVTVVNWYRLGGAGGFTVTNALPRGLAYQQSADASEEVSVDGGRSWGRIGTLKLGDRTATPEDITHVRWRVSPVQALAGAGRIAYAGFVR